jgi:exocyst complex component 8
MAQKAESSLRTPRRAPTRKQTIAPPVPIPGQGPIPRGPPKSRVDDRIKKRMSMRYAEMVTSPTEIPAMPGFPSASGEDVMSLGMGMGMIGDEDLMDRMAAKDDKKLLEDDKFEPEACGFLPG